MKSEEEIKKKLLEIRNKKNQCKYKCHDAGYVTNLKIETVLKWILDKE